MLIFILDDEPLVLEDTRTVVAQAAPEAEIRVFSLASQALEEISEQGLRPDVVFSDIEMPGFSGLELAREMTLLHPRTNICFLTGQADYVGEAWQLHATDYVLKPLTEAKLRNTLTHLRFPSVLNAAKIG